MKKIIVVISFILIQLNVSAQVVFVNKFDDAIIPPMEGKVLYDIDVNTDGELDFTIELYRNPSGEQLGCGSVGGSDWNACNFIGLNNLFGQNRLNTTGSAENSIDSKGDTLNILDNWTEKSFIYQGFPFYQNLCKGIGKGRHKQGFRLIKKNELNGATGFIFGYIDYTVTMLGEIILHGWYYENSFNRPIVVDSENLDSYCTIIETILIYDTISISVADTLTIDLKLTGSNDIEKDLLIKLYPNPASNRVTVDISSNEYLESSKLQVFNSIGEKVFEKTFTENLFYIDISDIGAQGIYYVRVLDNLNSLVGKKVLVIN